jgi:hypothetical protein
VTTEVEKQAIIRGRIGEQPVLELLSDVSYRGLRINENADVRFNEVAFPFQKGSNIRYIIDASAKRGIRVSINANEQSAMRHNHYSFGASFPSYRSRHRRDHQLRRFPILDDFEQRVISLFSACRILNHPSTSPNAHFASVHPSDRALN